MTDIKPYLDEDGEPWCNGKACPSFYSASIPGYCGKLLKTPADTTQNTMTPTYPKSSPCWPRLRQQRDEARHNLCMAVQEGDDGEWTYLNEAKVRGWGYLYE